MATVRRTRAARSRTEIGSSLTTATTRVISCSCASAGPVEDVSNTLHSTTKRNGMGRVRGARSGVGDSENRGMDVQNPSRVIVKPTEDEGGISDARVGSR